MPTRIKICGITRVEDALAASSLGADAIGLVFCRESPRLVSRALAQEIVRALPPFVAPVGLFVNADADEVKSTLQSVALALLQFHGEETPDFCRQFGRPYIKAARVKEGVDLLEYASRYGSACGLLLDAFVDGVYGGTGVSFDWALAPRGLPLPVILSGGLNPGNVGAAIRRVRPWAVDVSSAVESAKGIKDPAKIDAFIRGVRDADG